MNQQDTLVRPAEQLTWAEALNRHRRAEAEYDRVSTHYSDACRAYDAECPDRDAEFERYGLRCPNLERENIVRIVRAALCMSEFGGTGMFLYPPDKRAEQTSKMPEIAVDAERIADDYLAWRSHKSEAYDRIVGPAEEKHDAAVDMRSAARTALLETQAPDTEAMLFKLDLLSSIMAEGDAEDADQVVNIRDDARRLLTPAR